ncbi:MAG: AMP-binding protein, partial [Burkholderiaceae bacterium]
MPIDSPQVFIPDLLRSHARYRPQHEALVCGSQRLTWAEFGQSIDRVARRLQALGVGRGCQIAVLMNNRVELLTAIFGIVSSGACVVPLSGLLTAEQSLGLIRDSDAVGLMVSQEYAEKLLSTSNADDTTTAQNKLSLHCPALRDELLVVVTGNNFAASTQTLNGVQASDPLKSCYEPFIAWTDWLSQGHQDPVLTRTYEASDPFNIIYSSGTTG